LIRCHTIGDRDFPAYLTEEANQKVECSLATLKLVPQLRLQSLQLLGIHARLLPQGNTSLPMVALYQIRLSRRRVITKAL